MPLIVLGRFLPAKIPRRKIAPLAKKRKIKGRYFGSFSFWGEDFICILSLT